MSPPSSVPSIGAWWTAVEASATGATERTVTASGPAWLHALERAQIAEAALRPDEALAALGAARDETPVGPWRRVHALLELRATARRSGAAGLADVVARLTTLVDETPVAEAPTLARAWHLVGVVRMRRDELGRAEEALTRALDLIEEGPGKTWVLDGFGQVLLAHGAWEEGRKVLRAVAARKAAAGDVVGLAVTAGHWARMELGRDRPAAAEEALRVALDADPTRPDGTHRLPALSRLRLLSMLVEATLAARGADAAASAVRVLQEAMREIGSTAHYLRAFGHVALAQFAASKRDAAWSRGQLEAAARDADAPEMQAHVRTVAASLAPETLDDPEWWALTSRLLVQVGVPTETEVAARLLLAERAAGRGERASARAHLDAAFDLAAHANHPGWAARVDAVYERVDADGASRRRLERWTGATVAEAEQTRVVDATVVFADLVGYTPRSQVLSPEETLATVRSLFELSMPPMVAQRVRPVSYLGDGLLAVAEGEGHARRAVDFASEFVRRGARATLVRKAIGERWGLEIRAGVATGPVALGPLGTHVKLEYTVAGLTANLAARLQAQAEPGEVVFAEAGEAVDIDLGTRERLVLKGFPEPVGARRLRPEI